MNMNSRKQGSSFSSSSGSGSPHHSNQNDSSRWARKNKTEPYKTPQPRRAEAESVENTTSGNPQETPVVGSFGDQGRSSRGVSEEMVKSSYRERPVVDDSLSDSALREGGRRANQPSSAVECNFVSVVYPGQDDSPTSVTRKNEPSRNRTPHQRGTPWGSVERTTSRNSLEAPFDGGSSKQHQPSPKLHDKVVNVSHTEQPFSAVSPSKSVMSQTKSGLEDGSPPHSDEIVQGKVVWHKIPESSRKGMSQLESTSPNMEYPERRSTQAVVQALDTDENAIKGHSSAELSKKELSQHRKSPSKRESSCHSPDTPFDLFLGKPKGIILKKSLLEQKRAKKKEFERSINDSRPGKLRPGMVLLKNFITPEDQIKILTKCRDTGLGPGGFYQPGYSDGAKMHLHMMCLGKEWDPQNRSYEESRSIDGAKPPIIPDEFRKLVGDAIQASHVLIQENGVKYPDKEIPWMEPDICIVNFYTDTGKLGLHQDRDESTESINDGLPVVSFSIGDSAEFLFGDDRDVDKAKKIELKSGDVLIFGGKSRRIFHGVPSIIPKTAPEFLVDEVNLRPGRLNLTFRQY